MNFNTLDPSTLQSNPWNTNHLTPEAELKLENSLAKGVFKPVIVRTLPDGSLQILGGEHRNAAAIRIGLTEIPVINLGEIDDQRAKEISVIDNGRYGQDDAGALAELLREIGDPIDIASYMPFDTAEMTTMLAVADIDLSHIGFEDEDAPAATPAQTRGAKTHSVMRFKIPIDDQAHVERVIKETIKAQGFDDSDSMVNAGDALVWLINHGTAVSEE